MDPLVVDALLVASEHRSAVLERLTAREREMLREMARGLNNAGISSALTLTERAVAKHIKSLFAKLELHEEQSAHRRVQAVWLYLSATSS